LLRAFHRYNSAFFPSLSSNDYNVIYATADFVNGAAYNSTAIGSAWLPPGYDPAPVQLNISQYEKLDNSQCIQAYAKDFITDRRTVVVISSNISIDNSGSLLGGGNNELESVGSSYDPYSW